MSRPSIRTDWSICLEIALMILYGAITLCSYGLWMATAERTQLSVTPFDMRAALQMSLGFMVISGFLVTIVLLFVFYNRRQRWRKRAALNLGLFFAHIPIFMLLIGSTDIGPADLWLIALGAASVIAAEATAAMIWTRSGLMGPS